MTSAPIQFFFDYLSPYSYLAWTQIHGIAALHKREVEPVPVLFAALLDANGTRGPAEVPARRRYVFKDLIRLALAFGVPVNAPFAHPFNSLLALRVSSLPMDAGTRVTLVDAVFRATWIDRRRVVDPDVVAEIARSAGIDRDVIGEAQLPEAKQRVRDQTDRALALGAFGVPTLVVDDELFWGCDSLPHLERHLAGAVRIPNELVDRWLDLPSQAVRPGAKRN